MSRESCCPPPQPLDPDDTSSGLVSTRLDAAQRFALYRRLLAPRALLGYGLLQVNPVAAHNFLGDPEADARNDAVVEAPRAALRRCRARAAGARYRLLRDAVPAVGHRPAPPDPRPQLRGRTTSALILDTVRAFLVGRPLPVAPYEGDAPPSDYEGPP
ncbi:hypothetical protein PA7_42400 [Pseudonocardia asaccharolytica DSM 44247 = NBRC 16224]|uniref:Uncharacterized protein n=1 Tax=Pseudonocardia asaccharolytica DSM 44247 = NBRC 16224 TaxID=1123024 RepID=A0A511D7K8_9PSEU|nr:hypothetical protein [Pseudonocardia asaccharolytica]GEL20403.1 hypothetical protein PA7_42400 [Pseudonocardia asaccharolytica DSM 44247 = NBRC 16224]